MPQAARAQEAGSLVAFEIQVDEQESAHGYGLVVREVGAAKAAIKVGGEQISVARRSETGQGHAIGQPSTAERRLRQLLILYPAVLVLLLPVPDTWVNFWFWSTLLAAVSGLISLGLLLRTPGRRGRT